MASDQMRLLAMQSALVEGYGENRVGLVIRSF